MFPPRFTNLCTLFLAATVCIAESSVGLTIEPYTFQTHDHGSVDAERGTLAVKYDRDNPESPFIDLNFIRFPATTDTPGPPLVYLAGGPGGSGMAAAQGDRFELFMALRQLGDVIAWDQRGTGLSEPRVSLETKVDIPYEGQISTEWIRDQFALIAREADAQFQRDGFDPIGLNTNASADDLEDLRIALGSDQLRLWSISYGTHLALATIKRYPDSIESAVLAGVEGLDSTYKLPNQVDAPIAALSREIAADPHYGKHIPDFGLLLREVLDGAPYPVEVTDPDTGETVETDIGRAELEVAAWSALFRRDRMSILPMAFLSVSNGNTAMLARVVGMTRGRNAMGGGNAMSLAMNCASGVSQERLEQIDRELSDALFQSVLNIELESKRPVFQRLDLGDKFRSPVESEIPILCLSGELDVRTPPSNAEEILKGFPNGHHVIIGRAGHDDDLWVSSPKIEQCILAFFREDPIPFDRIQLPNLEFMVPDED